jgi:two-component system, LytTR family, sensor kinase
MLLGIVDAMEQLSTAELVGQAYGFTIGTTLATLLLMLVRRSGGTDRRPRFLFAMCILIANCAGLAKNVALLLGCTHGCVLVQQIRALGFSSAAMLPLSLLMIWRDNAVLNARRRVGNVLVYYAASSGALIALALTLGAWGHTWLSHALGQQSLSNQDSVGNLTFYNGLALVVVGGIVLLPGTLNNITDRVAVILMVTGLSLSSVSAALEAGHSLPATLTRVVSITKFQSAVLVVIAALFYFSRFRAADIFAKQALRFLVGAALALLASIVIVHPIASLSQTVAHPAAINILLIAAATGCAVLLYGRLAKWTDVLVERRIFGKPDARLAIREFRDQLGLWDSKSAVLTAMQTLGAKILGISPDQLSIHNAAECMEESGGLVIPIPLQGDALQFAVSLIGKRKVLLSTEIDFLQEIAIYAGRRLDEIDHDEERISRIQHEGQLNRQLMESELRALRAQINPHFLFNSLNTIASLIASDPEKAETITVRLAGIFRYVLLHADRPFSSLDEETDFLRTYLDIEQIRFGERLSVEFDLEPSIAHTPVPSLILQPLVENAIKHGIAPKIGRSRILVQSKRRGGSIFLSIEDDGIGLHGKPGQTEGSSLSGNGSGAGVGLQNIRERLQTMYGGCAGLTLVNIPGGGSRATLEIPIAE